MVTLKGTFDASQYESTFTLIDPGRYVAIVKDSELLQRSDGATGVTLKFEIQSGDFNGAIHSENYTIFSAPKEEHLQFARQAFARVCDACNMSLVQDTAQLHNIPIGIEIGNGKPWTDREGNQRESRRLVRVWSLQTTKPESVPAEQPQQPSPEPQPNYAQRPAFMQPQQEQDPSKPPF
ncbi:MAG: hypothetical protein IJQ39_08125 [Thermoguttaceae bacterium]|nr:hypothetical protein [Thermoguttaceae bacterium]